MGKASFLLKNDSGVFPPKSETGHGSSGGQTSERKPDEERERVELSFDMGRVSQAVSGRK